MQINLHYSGVAIAFEQHGGVKKGRIQQQKTSRPHGSRTNRQKRAIADATEYMRRHGKALIFVATSPGFIHAKDENKAIKNFTHNLRNGLSIKNYIWVRELTAKGYPHYHFLVDTKRIKDPVNLSIYWSGFFGVSSTNSIRLGSKPDKNGKRKFFVNSPAMARYLAKYLGKGINDETKKTSCKSFRISNDLAERSKPVTFYPEYIYQKQEGTVMNCHGQFVQKPEVAIGRKWISKNGLELNPNLFLWKQPKELHSVFFGNVRKHSQLVLK